MGKRLSKQERAAARVQELTEGRPLEYWAAELSRASAGFRAAVQERAAQVGISGTNEMQTLYRILDKVHAVAAESLKKEVADRMARVREEGQQAGALSNDVLATVPEPDPAPLPIEARAAASGLVLAGNITPLPTRHVRNSLHLVR